VISFVQSTARSRSPSFSGPSDSFTKNPSGEIIRVPPFFSSLYAMGLEAYPNSFTNIFRKRELTSAVEILVSNTATLTPLSHLKVFCLKNT